MHKVAVVAAAIAFGSAAISTDALARGGGGGGGMGAGHGGDGFGGGHFGRRFADGGAFHRFAGNRRNFRHDRFRFFGIPYTFDDSYCWPHGYYRSLLLVSWECRFLRRRQRSRRRIPMPDMKSILKLSTVL
jgi:hypothetical protein